MSAEWHPALIAFARAVLAGEECGDPEPATPKPTIVAKPQFPPPRIIPADWP